MKIAVIVPTFNRATLLPHAIQSILNQDGDFTLEIIVVDDGSSDNTQEILNDICSDEPCIKNIYQPNGGVSAARNFGLAHLADDTEFVTFLDSDDIFAAQRISGHLVHFTQRPKIGYTFGREVMTDQLDYTEMRPTPGANCLSLACVSLASCIFRRNLFNTIGGFDETLVAAEDVDFLLRLAEQQVPFYQDNLICRYYFRHSDNMTNAYKKIQQAIAQAMLRSVIRRKKSQRPLLKPAFDTQELREQYAMSNGAAT